MADVNIPAGRVQVATPATMAASIRTGTEATKAVDERIESVAVDIITDSPELIAAAAERALSDQALIRGLTTPTDQAHISWAVQTYGDAWDDSWSDAWPLQATGVSVPAVANVPVLDGSGLIHRSQLPPVSMSGRAPDITDFGAVGDGVTNDGPAIQAALDAVGETGGTLTAYVPGVYLSMQGLVVPGSVTWVGAGAPYAELTNPLAVCSIIRAGIAMGALVTLGADVNSSAPQNTAAGIENLVVDGADLANYAVLTNGRRWLIERCYIFWGLLSAVEVHGQNGNLRHSYIAQNNRGDCVVLRSEPDNKIVNNQIRQAGPNGACILLEPLGSSSVGNGNVLISGNHMWLGENGIPLTGVIIRARVNASKTLADVMVYGNSIEGCIGDHIELIATDSAFIRTFKVVANNIFQNPSSPDDTYSVIRMLGNASIFGVEWSANNVSHYSTHRTYRSFIHDEGTGPRSKSEGLASVTDECESYGLRALARPGPDPH